MVLQDPAFQHRGVHRIIAKAFRTLPIALTQLRVTLPVYIMQGTELQRVSLTTISTD